MAYFPNGSAGADFQAMNCDRCANWKERPGDPMRTEGEGCPVWDAHFLTGSYGSDDLRMALNVLIYEPEDRNEFPVCRMFEESSDAD